MHSFINVCIVYKTYTAVPEILLINKLMEHSIGKILFGENILI